MQNNEEWYKNDDSDTIWWLYNPDVKGEFIFSFDKKKKYNLFADYPKKLSEKEREIFDKDTDGYWKVFFADRGGFS